MEYTTPLMFKNAFETVLSKNEDSILAAWKNWSKYTYLFVGKNNKNSIIQQIAIMLDLKCYCEYWTIDSVFYKSKDTDNFYEYNNYANYIDVAIEHENDIKTSCQEVNKLSIINTPLKVLITYPDETENETHYLNKYIDVIKRADIFSDFGNLRRQLVIFGYKDGMNLCWKYYVYKNNDFIPL